MSARDTGETPIFPSGPPADPPPASPSWDIGARPAVPLIPPRAAPPPASTEAPPKPYYAAAPPPLVPPLTPAAPPPSASTYQAEDVKYDLSGNPIPSSGVSARPLQGQTSFAPTPGVWPPQPTTTPYGASSAYGMSGGENGTDKVARLRWNWGAFLIPFWWCIFNGQRNIAWGIFAANTASRYTPAPFSYILLLAVFGISVYLGLTGHRLAWASGRAMGDYDAFIRQQQAWMIWGFVIVVVVTIGLAALFSVIGGLPGALGGGFGHPTGGSAPYPRGGN